ncbi:beta-galactosidase [Actinopolymorpha alba]|uniref:beta-galactosidase n=1 Tax=Actinopolymorpha alba TaxID=533267 RepID=UPI00037B0808|nr:beta-galactosidase [Actinopolymorpha alba]
MATFTYDSKSFRRDGERIWIVGGEVHYFRHPRAEWRDVLLRAKRAGLNTIATYVPWNFHEPREGVMDFSGDRDLGSYLDLIGDLGMLAMVRPGPYICSEWDGGGLPVWLCARPVRRFREDDPVYMAAVERWFDRLIPLISERQVTRGGPVITIQNENEYPGGWDDSMRRYVRRLNELFRKHGIEIPILACNVHAATDTTIKINSSTDPRDQLIEPDMILTYNHHTVVEPVYDLKARQPDAPLIATEFWSGAPHYWGDPVADWPDARSLARAAYEYASAGTQVVYYMFEGGTNFGFWAGNNIVTSYASGYPVGDGGLLTDKYYAIRPANLFASEFAELLADSVEVPEAAGVTCPGGARVVVRRCDRGDLVFLSVGDGRPDAVLGLPDGRSVLVPFGEVAAVVLPLNLAVFDRVTVDYSNLTLLARDEARRALVLFGPAGSLGVISVNGDELSIPVRRGAVEHRQVDDLSLLVVDEELARRCWIAGGHVVFGPDYVADVAEDGSLELKVSPESPEVVRLDTAGAPVRQRCETRVDEVDLPELSTWRRFPCTDLTLGRSPGWTSIDAPLAHEELGITQGYVWYAAEVESAKGGVDTLLLTHAPNRVSVFVNGTYSGTHAEHRSVRMRDEYAHPADWAFEELTVRLNPGTNTLVFLSDDLGHNYDVPVPVGIQGPVYVGSRRVEIDNVRDVGPFAVSAEAYAFLYDRFYRKPDPLPAVEFDLLLGPDEDAFVTIHGVHAWVTVDGVDILPMSYPESPWTMFSAIKRWHSWQLPARRAGESSVMRIQHAGGSAQAVLENLTVYVVPRCGRCTGWRWQPWRHDADAGSAATIRADETEKDPVLVLLPAGGQLARKNRSLTPAWYETRFPMPAGDRPVHLAIGELRKGQVFLNGHNVGRFWSAGRSQEHYYLPRSWMTADNQLVIFEELGCLPQEAALVFGEAGRWTSVRLPAD